MRALTFWRPWVHAILYGGKRIENRSWKPWDKVVGHYIALHSGLKYDGEGAFWMREQDLYDPPGVKDCQPGCILGVAQLTGYVTENESPWFVGPYGWTFDNVVSFSSPIEVTGRQGLWILDEEMEKAVWFQVMKQEQESSKI
jgi:hypothetical protein